MVLTLLLLSATIFAQERVITGTVTEGDEGQTIVGGTVLIKGTTSGTITSPDGKYSIPVRGNDDILVFQFIGLVSKEVPVGDKTVINVQLDVETTALDEVVVIGYGTQKKSDLTGSVAVISSEEIIKSNAATLDKALQGKAAGVLVTNTSGVPGGGVSIKIRGIGSISRDSEPLYVIDGVPAGGISTLNPADIASVQVLKDASATAIYGARGSNGVILIETKRGKSGPPKVNFSAYAGVSTVTNMFDVMNSEEYVNLIDKAYELDPERDMPFYYGDSVRNAHGNVDTDWQNEMFRPAWNQNYNLSVSGGGENSNYAISGNYYQEDGVIKKSQYERMNLRANSDFEIGERLKIGESLTVTQTRSDRNGGSWSTAIQASPLMPVYDTTAIGGYAGPTDTITVNNDRTNPIAGLMLNDNHSKSTRILTNLYAELKLFKGLTYKFSIGMDYRTTLGFNWRPENELGNIGLRSNVESTLTQSTNDSRFLLIQNIVNYTNSFGKHNLTVMAGHTTEQSNFNNFSATGQGFVNPDLNVLAQSTTYTTITGTRNEHKIESYLGRLTYDYAGKYLLTASIRRDGSTNFGPTYRYGYFPSFSLGWKISEDFLQHVDEIDMLKVRFGYGVTGNENIGSFQYLERMDKPTNTRYVFGDDQITHYGGTILSTHGNPDVRWESAKMTNIGVDLFAFNNQLQFSAEYYRKNQDNMLVRLPLPTVVGKLSFKGVAEPFVNLGEVQNRGFEFSVIWKKTMGSFDYSVNANVTTIKNEVVYLPGDDIWNHSATTITTEGHTIGSFFGYVADGIFQNQEEVDNHATQTTGTAPGDIKFRDLNYDGVITEEDRTIIGKALPDLDLGFGFDCAYKGFDFSIFFHGALGMDVYNGFRSSVAMGTDPSSSDINKVKDVMNNYWSGDGSSTTMTRLATTDPNDNDRFSSWFVEDASFLRVQNMQIGYTIPKQVLPNISRMRVYVSASNLYIITKYSGYDPEVGPNFDSSIGNYSSLDMGFDNGPYPMPRMIQFGVQADF